MSKQAIVVEGVEIPGDVHSAMLQVRNWAGLHSKRQGGKLVGVTITSGGSIKIDGLAAEENASESAALEQKTKAAAKKPEKAPESVKAAKGE